MLIAMLDQGASKIGKKHVGSAKDKSGEIDITEDIVTIIAPPPTPALAPGLHTTNAADGNHPRTIPQPRRSSAMISLRQSDTKRRRRNERSGMLNCVISLTRMDSVVVLPPTLAAAVVVVVSRPPTAKKRTTK